MKVSGWARYPIIDTELTAPRNIEELRKIVCSGEVIARGNGRSYGDSAVGPSSTIHMKHFNRILAFNPESGCLVAEAGVMLSDIIETFLKLGWFPPVTPGTKFVTIGGMIAADVHGKNHHLDGSIGSHVDWIEVLVADGSIVRCSQSENTELFQWTIGGMGLTGVIVRAALCLRRVPSAWIKQRTIVADNIHHAIDIFEQSLDVTYSVAWIDCFQKGDTLGRCLVMLGEHAEVSELPLNLQKLPYSAPARVKRNIRFTFPNWVLNSHSVRVFNKLYFRLGARGPEHKIVDWDTYFYPLDSIQGWNKIYGRSGFAQFQCVIPLLNAEKGMRELIEEISNAGLSSFLAVLKRFGKQSSLFSFPMEGYTLALDFPINEKTLALMTKLDEITLKYDGRFYLAKDSRMSRTTFHQSDARAQSYLSYRNNVTASDKFASIQSKRLNL